MLVMTYTLLVLGHGRQRAFCTCVCVCVCWWLLAGLPATWQQLFGFWTGTLVTWCGVALSSLPALPAAAASCVICARYHYLCCLPACCHCAHYLLPHIPRLAHHACLPPPLMCCLLPFFNTLCAATALSLHLPFSAFLLPIFSHTFCFATCSCATALLYLSASLCFLPSCARFLLPAASP